MQKKDLMKILAYLLLILTLTSCTKEAYYGEAFVDREFYFNDEIYRVDTKKSTWIESSKHYQCPTIGTPVVFYVEFSQKPIPGKYKVVNYSQKTSNQASMTITKLDLNTGNLEAWKSESGDLVVDIVDSVLVNNTPTKLVKFQFGGPVIIKSSDGKEYSTTGIFYAKY